MLPRRRLLLPAERVVVQPQILLVRHGRVSARLRNLRTVRDGGLSPD